MAALIDSANRLIVYLYVRGPLLLIFTQNSGVRSGRESSRALVWVVLHKRLRLLAEVCAHMPSISIRICQAVIGARHSANRSCKDTHTSGCSKCKRTFSFFSFLFFFSLFPLIRKRSTGLCVLCHLHPESVFALERHRADILSALVIDCKQGRSRLKAPLTRVPAFCVFFPVTFYSLGSVAGSSSNNYCLYMINLKPSCSVLSRTTQCRAVRGGRGERGGVTRLRSLLFD